MKLLFVYLTVINALSFLLMIIDKVKAIKKRWRIPEKILLGTAALGGSLGAFLGMYLVRHKTRHAAFYVGIPVMLLLHAAIIFWIFL